MDFFLFSRRLVLVSQTRTLEPSACVQTLTTCPGREAWSAKAPRLAFPVLVSSIVKGNNAHNSHAVKTQTRGREVTQLLGTPVAAHVERTWV